MVRLERRADAVVVVSRLARPRVLAVLAATLLGSALLARGPLPRLSAVLALAAAGITVLGGRPTRARFARGRVVVRPAVPFGRAVDRPLEDFTRSEVETAAAARARKAEQLARSYRDRSGGELPAWLRGADASSANDHLRRVVLVPRAGEPLPVTTWVPLEDDLEPARQIVDALLGVTPGA